MGILTWCKGITRIELDAHRCQTFCVRCRCKEHFIGKVQRASIGKVQRASIGKVQRASIGKVQRWFDVINRTDIVKTSLNMAKILILKGLLQIYGGGGGVSS